MEIINIESIIEEITLENPYFSKELENNIIWYQENRNKLSRYENNWIAIYNQDIVAFCANPYELEKQIHLKSLPIKDVFMHYLVDSNCIF